MQIWFSNIFRVCLNHKEDIIIKNGKIVRLSSAEEMYYLFLFSNLIIKTLWKK